MSEPQNTALISVRDLDIAFPVAGGEAHVVDGVTLEAGLGEAIGIVGESGSGKSMTALSLLRLLPHPGRVAGGSISFAGEDLLALDDRAVRRLRTTDLAMIFQDAGSYLNPVMTVGDQIAEAIGRRGSRDAEVLRRVDDSLRAVQIADPGRIARSYPHELSGGMQQRVMIASVLIRAPRLIVADEPTTALDATVQHQILLFLKELRHRINTTLILISHDLAVVADVCDRVYVMYGGQIVEQGGAMDLFEDPKHPYTRALVDSILDPFDPKPEVRALEGTPPDMARPPSGCRFHPRCPEVFAGCDRHQPAMHDIEDGRQVRCRLYDGVAERGLR